MHKGLWLALGGAGLAATIAIAFGRRKKAPRAVVVIDEASDLDALYATVEGVVRLTPEQLGQSASQLPDVKGAIVLWRVPIEVIVGPDGRDLRSVDAVTAGLAESARKILAAGAHGIVVIPPVRIWTGAYAQDPNLGGRVTALRRGAEMLTRWARSVTAPRGHESDPLFNAVVSIDALMGADGQVLATLSDATGLNAAGIAKLGEAVRIAVEAVRR